MSCGIPTRFLLAFFRFNDDKYTLTMIGRSWAFSITVLLAVLLPSHGQSSPAQVPAKGDYSQEAAVIEELSTRVSFANDGNSTHEQTVRIRVQSDAGVKHWGLLTFPFQSATQTVEIDYVRVHKADGSTVITPPDNIQELDSEITRSAPFYSDLREKHVAVKGLGKGDSLEYAAHWRTTKPLIPGQFWFQYNFERDGIVLAERLEIKVPGERAVKVKGPQATQTITTDAGFRTYSWTYSRLQNTKDPESDQKKETEAALGRLTAPDVQISSFQNWEEVGLWYWNLQKDRIEPTPAIRAKAAELTKGMTDDGAKLRALYSFVSTQYRYIGIAFGIGRYQPHSADDVLTNNYGDCKDKHTLLASLLEASGITLYPALISSSWKLDPDVPSPAQFDHVIGYLPQGKDKDAVWLDTTLEVAPFGYLVQRLRDKQALVMSGEKFIRLETTPVDPPFPSSQAFKIDAKLSDDGTLEAKIDDTTRGENEAALRLAFRQVPEPKWKDLAQQISYGLGYAGTVGEASASTPEAINEPFHFSYSYNRKDYPDWSNRQFTVPGLPFYMPPVRDDAKYPIWLGAPLETVSDSRVELPKGYRPQVPPNVDLKYDFAEYHASYSQDQGVLIAKRRLLIKLHEIPVAELDDYRSFVKNLQNDVNRYVQTLSSSGSIAPYAGAIPNGSLMPDASSVARLGTLLNSIMELPASASAEANQSATDGRNSLGQGDRSSATDAFKHAVELDPKFTRAWLMLGVVYMASGQSDPALSALRTAIDTDPKQIIARRTYALALAHLRRPDEAVDAWRDALKIAPDDPRANTEIGTILMQQKRYSEALSYLETAAKGDNSPSVQAILGSAYLLAGKPEKANVAFAKLAELDTDGNYFNDVAYQMANADLNLPFAIDLAKKAVRRAEEESQKTTLADLQLDNLREVEKLSAYWDTLGWAEERMSRLEDAEQHLKAAWRLTQDGVVAGHLCDVYKRAHRVELAIQMCRMAIYRMPTTTGSMQFQTEIDAAKENLERMTAGMPKSKGAVDASDMVVRERDFRLPRFLPGTESAEFFVLLASDGKSKKFKVEDVKFISGSDKMKLQGKQLKSIDFNVPAPDEVPTRFVRRGILGCYQYTGCSFTLLDAASVNSLN
jgi:Tfp pilus assembly protein PilF